MSTPGLGSGIGSPIIYGRVDSGATHGYVYRPLNNMTLVKAGVIGLVGTTYTVQKFDQLLVLQGNAPLTVLLPSVSDWLAKPHGMFPIIVKDDTTNGASDANPITITPFGTDQINGLAQSFKIIGNDAILYLVPLIDNSGWVTI